MTKEHNSACFLSQDGHFFLLPFRKLSSLSFCHDIDECHSVGLLKAFYRGKYRLNWNDKKWMSCEYVCSVENCMARVIITQATKCTVMKNEGARTKTIEKMHYGALLCFLLIFLPCDTKARQGIKTRKWGNDSYIHVNGTKWFFERNFEATEVENFAGNQWAFYTHSVVKSWMTIISAFYTHKKPGSMCWWENEGK